MCQFASWKEEKGNVFFLEDKDLKGKKFKEYKEYNPQWAVDIKGHGAIEYFYPELKSLRDSECTDFSTPNNFPKVKETCGKYIDFSKYPRKMIIDPKKEYLYLKKKVKK